MDFKDYYKIMGVEPDASAEEIKRAYKKLARKYHPDVSDESDAQNKFQEIGEAYDILKDPEKRAEYDQLRTYVNQGGAQRRTADGGQTFTFEQGDFAGTDFEDLLKSVFGEREDFDMGGSRQGFGFGQRRQRQQQGNDIHHALTVTMEEAYHGGSRQVSLAMPDGDTRKINVKIPKGITDGKELRLKGQGQPGSAPGLEGDLYLEIRIASHPVFELEGKNVTLVLPVTPWEAALGAEVEIPTLGGNVSMKIPANSSSGNRLRLKGRGLPGDPPGDQFAILSIVNPEVESEEERTLFEQLRDKFQFDPRAKLKGAQHG
ncbi:MAG: DnaJ C-terminal domain-containing protein [Pseudomonadales bacterium]